MYQSFWLRIFQELIEQIAYGIRYLSMWLAYKLNPV
jgi:hypothetical protein